MPHRVASRIAARTRGRRLWASLPLPAGLLVLVLHHALVHPPVGLCSLQRGLIKQFHSVVDFPNDLALAELLRPVYWREDCHVGEVLRAHVTDTMAHQTERRSHRRRRQPEQGRGPAVDLFSAEPLLDLATAPEGATASWKVR
jgi:hypothetical protein